jgi:hypothetical protein
MKGGLPRTRESDLIPHMLLPFGKAVKRQGSKSPDLFVFQSDEAREQEDTMVKCRIIWFSNPLGDGEWSDVMRRQ